MTPEPGREALAAIVAGLEGVTEGKWRKCGGVTAEYTAIHSERGYIVFGMAERWRQEGGKKIEAPDMWEQQKNAAHIARCHPEAIRSIADYVAKVEKERDEARLSAQTVGDQLGIEIDRLIRERDAARKQNDEHFVVVSTDETDQDGFNVERRIAWKEILLARATTAEARAEAAEERVAVLEEALKPFAACADEIDYNDKEREEPTSDDEWAKFRLLVGDYRRARNALKRDTQNADQ